MPINSVVTSQRKNQIALLEAVKTLSITLLKFARYGDNCLEMRTISAASESWNYELMVKTLMDCPEISLDQKVELVPRYENTRVENCLKMQEKVVEGMKGGGSVAISCAGLWVLNTIVKDRGRNSQSLWRPTCSEDNGGQGGHKMPFFLVLWVLRKL